MGQKSHGAGSYRKAFLARSSNPVIESRRPSAPRSTSPIDDESLKKITEVKRNFDIIKLEEEMRRISEQISKDELERKRAYCLNMKKDLNITPHKSGKIMYFIGIFVMPCEINGMKTEKIIHVIPQSPAERSGLRFGDVVHRHRFPIRDDQAGIILEYNRGGKKMDAFVKMGETISDGLQVSFR